jgi:hypothetical protein
MALKFGLSSLPPFQSAGKGGRTPRSEVSPVGDIVGNSRSIPKPASVGAPEKVSKNKLSARLLGIGTPKPEGVS